MLYIVPLEKYEERYTEQWSRWIPDSLRINDVKFETIQGDVLTNTIESGEVLDCFNTNFFKFSQLQKIIVKIRNGEIKEGDHIWFADLWFPGIESLFYIRNITGIKFKISGILHAGTWDFNDFTYRY